MQPNRSKPQPARKPPRRSPPTARRQPPAPGNSHGHPPSRQVPTRSPAPRIGSIHAERHPQPPHRPGRPTQAGPTPARSPWPIIIGGAISAVAAIVIITAVILGLVLLSRANEIVPGVHVMGVDLGGLTESEAAYELRESWADSLVLRDGDRVWAVTGQDQQALGITLNADASAAAAQNHGNGLDALRGLFGAKTVHIAPVLDINLGQARAYLESVAPALERPPVNAGIALVSGQAVATPGVAGRRLNIDATLERLRVNAAAELADGALDLDMLVTPPAIADSTPLVNQANRLLAGPFTVQAFDAVRGETLTWTASPTEWAGWLTAAAADASGGLALSMTVDGPAAFLARSAAFNDERYIDPDQAVEGMRAALAQGQTTAAVRILHGETTYTVRSGQTLASIGEEVGIPYPYIQEANPGINANALSAGQVLTLPSKDVLIPIDPLPQRHKRIIIYRGQQRMEAYENGQIVYNWVISTGISTSPTALGVFQVQSHELNAYADQWDLYMPHFIGFYHPGPNASVMNGFHGFPTRNTGYLLWTDDLGRPATYGCVLLNLQNAEMLYTWASDGVIVEVRG